VSLLYFTQHSSIREK
jgi:hypothetical protein